MSNGLTIIPVSFPASSTRTCHLPQCAPCPTDWNGYLTTVNGCPACVCHPHSTTTTLTTECLPTPCWRCPDDWYSTFTTIGTHCPFCLCQPDPFTTSSSSLYCPPLPCPLCPPGSSNTMITRTLGQCPGCGCSPKTTISPDRLSTFDTHPTPTAPVSLSQIQVDEARLAAVPMDRPRAPAATGIS